MQGWAAQGLRQGNPRRRRRERLAGAAGRDAGPAWRCLLFIANVTCQIHSVQELCVLFFAMIGQLSVFGMVFVNVSHECSGRRMWIRWIWRRLSLGQPVLHPFLEFSLLTGPICGSRFGNNMLIRLLQSTDPLCKTIFRVFATLVRGQPRFLCPALLYVHEMRIPSRSNYDLADISSRKGIYASCASLLSSHLRIVERKLFSLKYSNI